MIFYSLCGTKCKFPDFSLTFSNIHFFPWPSPKFPDFSLTFARSGISLTFPWPLDTLYQALCIISKSSVNSNWSYSPETLNLGQNWWFFVPCDLKIWRMTLKNNRAHLICYFKLCASFHSHLWNQNEATVRKHQIWVKISDFLSRVTLKFYRWPWKTIGHLFYATSSFVHHFIAICEFKMELQSGNAQFVPKLAIFCPVWPWNFTDDFEKQ